MKKQTKKLMWVFFIVFIMAGSSIAYIIIGTIPEIEEQEQQPKEFVIEGKLNETLKEIYIGKGYTVMEFHYYENCCPSLLAYVDSLPEELNHQLIVEKIKDSEHSWVLIESINDRKEGNVTKMIEVFELLCNVLIKPPMDCGLLNRTA